MLLFVVASFSPAVLLAVAAAGGGVFPLVALAWTTGAVFWLDRVGLAEPKGGSAGFAGILTVILGLVHLALMPAVVAGLDHMPPGESVIMVVAAGLFFGQLANSNAHELIHRASRWPRLLGAAVYSALLFGHHVSAHRLVHHVHVGSAGDPNSARRGESFYRFWPRAWIGSFRAGLAAVNRQRAGAALPRPVWTHPYLGYVAGAGAALTVAFAIDGWRGVLLWVAVCAIAQMQLLLADYVQHYGLRRARQPDGTLEPAGARHSWNAGQVWSGAMMLNAPHHSDHHMHPARPFPALHIDDASMPLLPASLSAMAFVAACPPLWRRIMDPRLAAWQSNATGQAMHGANGSDLA